MQSPPKTTPNRKAVVWDYNAVFSASDELRCYQLSDQHIQALMSTLAAMEWRTRWTDAPEDMREILTFVGELAYRLLAPTSCEPSAVPMPNQGNYGVGAGSDFDQFLELLMELDMKFQMPDGSLWEPAIPLVPCGCGTSDSSAVNLDGQSQELDIPGASSGGTYGDYVTLCDAVSVLPGYLDTAWRAYLNELNKFAQGGGILDFGNDVLESLSRGVLDSIDDLFVMLDSAAFQALTRAQVIKYFADPWKRPTRADMKGFGYSFPQSVNGAPAWAMTSLWSQTANIDELDNAVRAAKGQGNINDCISEFAEHNRVPFTNATPTQVQPAPPSEIDEELANDSGIAGLRLVAVIVDAAVSSPAGYVEVPTLTALVGNTIYAEGFNLSYNEGSTTTGLLVRTNGGQNATIITGGFSGGAVGEVSGANGSLSTATRDEIASKVAALAGYTPSLSQTRPAINIVNNDQIRIGGNVNTGRMEFNLVFLVVAPT